MSELYPEDSDGAICELYVEELKQQKASLYTALIVIQNKLKFLENEKQKLISKFDENKMNNEIELKKSQVADKEYLYSLISKYEQKIRETKQDINDCETAIFVKYKH
jgi:hypothetical protein